MLGTRLCTLLSLKCGKVTVIKQGLIAFSRDPYSCFIKVVSQASKPNDTLGRANLGYPRVIWRGLVSLILSEVKSSPPQTHCSGQ